MLLLLPLFYFLYIQMNCQIYAQNKQCTNCKFFIPYKNNKHSNLGLCKMFGTRFDYDNSKKNTKIIYNFAQHCRDDETLCGKIGLLYEEIEPNTNDTEYNNPENKMFIMKDELKKIMNDYYIFLRNDNDW
jgi:hypothetical protein